MIIRLDKYLADMQIGTRKEVKELIKKGRITVNNEKSVSSDTKIDTERDIIMMDSEIITYSEFEYYMLNKPAGVVSASNDPKNKTVINLIKSKRKDLFQLADLTKIQKVCCLSQMMVSLHIFFWHQKAMWTRHITL